jgi:hypothetical protein
VAVGRHRHAVTVRADGLATVLGPLLRDPWVRAAALVDVGSGMVLDSWGRGDTGDPELVSAAAAELVRVAVGMLGSAEPEVVVRLGSSWHHLVRAVPDPRGGPLALSVVVRGSQRAVERTRRRLGRVPVAALCAGPGLSRRPVDGTWVLPTAAPPPASAARLSRARLEPPPLPVFPAAPARSATPVAPARPAPPAALPPGRRVP